MRLKACLKLDGKFQLKHGFIAIYMVITILYLLLLNLLPKDWLRHVLPILIFSDPSAIGLFFIGGMIMLERTQGVLDYLVITPLTMKEYILSKIITLTALSVCVGLALSLLSDISFGVNYFFLVVGIIEVSVLFILIGILVAPRTRSLNHYIVKLIPILFFAYIPCISLIGFRHSEWFLIIPSVSGLRIIYGAFNGARFLTLLGMSMYLTLVNVILFKKVLSLFEREVVYGG